VKYLAALLCTIPVTAFALSEPQPSAKDGHVRTVAYDPMNRTELVIRAGDVTNITFQPMETIDHAIKAETAPFDYPMPKQGDDAGYSNNLPIIGKKAGGANLVVITRAAPPDDKERAYNIYVRVVDADDPAVTYQLTFTYGAAFQVAKAPDPNAPRQLSWKEKKAAADAEIAAARLRSDVSYGPQNVNYKAQGKYGQISPVTARDNGSLTAFRYPVNMQQPAFYRVLDNRPGVAAACSGQRMDGADLKAPEEAVNTRVVNDEVIVDHTAPHWRVRSGEMVIDLYNCGYDPVGTSTGTGTGSPDVVRRIVAR
jgi:type IV secretory pathway VirB9-like protein